MAFHALLQPRLGFDCFCNMDSIYVLVCHQCLHLGHLTRYFTLVWDVDISVHVSDIPGLCRETAGHGGPNMGQQNCCILLRQGLATTFSL